MIYTSYYAKTKNIDSSLLVNIARFVPKSMRTTMPSYADVVPTAEMLLKYKKDQDCDSYVKEYREKVLSKLSPAKVAKDLEGKVLCCYEKSTDFCHRHILAEWLQENGFKCSELV